MTTLPNGSLTSPSLPNGTLTSPSLPNGTLKSPSLPNLPLELIEEEILCRLPVKLLLQLRCICKSWNSLISHPKFTKKHLHLSKKLHNHLIVSSNNNLDEFVLLDSPISSVLSTSRAPKLTQLSYPITPMDDTYRGPRCVSSCDGILCFTVSDSSAVLWNPSIRKLKILPPFDNSHTGVSYSFGYHHSIDNYKIIGISLYTEPPEVSVLTLGDDYWRRIRDFPYVSGIYGPGIFVSGTVNWLAYDSSSSSRVIVSLDLEKESYQKLPQPDLDIYFSNLGVLRDCLCFFAYFFARNRGFLDVWIMKEYGNKESWTKLHTVPNMIDQGLSFYPYTKVLYVFEDGKMLFDFHVCSSNKLKLVVYDSKNDTFNIPKIQNINRRMKPDVYIESLISPGSLC